MKIDFKARLRNKAFWIGFISLLVLLSQQLGVKIFPSNWSDILNTILGILTLLGIIVDTSTEGFSDKETKQ